jgi:hypothetical protein
MPSDRFQPALLGGLFIGVLSALPLVSAGNCCCCLWIVGGGLIAAYLTQNTSPTAITVGDGALAGLMAGIVGAVVSTILAIPVRLVFGPLQERMAERFAERARDIPEALRVFIHPGHAGGAGVLFSLVLGFLLMLVLCVVFSTVGGMIGAAIFNRSKPRVLDVPPPPPPGL